MFPSNKISKRSLKTTVLIAVFITCLLVLDSCKVNCDFETNKTVLKERFLSKVNIPEHELLSTGTQQVEPTISKELRKKRFTILHFFTADCSNCIDELRLIQHYLAKYKNEEVNYIFFAGAPTRFYAQEAIDKLKFPYPVYFEQTYFSYKNANNFPLADKAYNTLLLDKQGKLLALGAFYDNKMARDLYDATIACY